MSVVVPLVWRLDYVDAHGTFRTHEVRTWTEHDYPIPGQTPISHRRYGLCIMVRKPVRHGGKLSGGGSEAKGRCGERLYIVGSACVCLRLYSIS